MEAVKNPDWREIVESLVIQAVRTAAAAICKQTRLSVAA
jgi:hypothetical protein